MKHTWAKRWIGEFVVIVLGVLVALGVNDWRQYRAERELEAYLLERLALDLEADLADLRLAQVMAARRQWVVEAILTDLSDGLPDGHPEVVPADSLVNPTSVKEQMARQGRTGGVLFHTWDPTREPLFAFEGTPEFDLSDDSFQEMVVTGSLRTLRDRELRSNILTYYRIAEDMGENERREAQYAERLEAALGSIGVAVGDSINIVELASKIAGDSRATVELRRAQLDLRYQQQFLAAIEQFRSQLEASLPQRRAATS